MIQFARVMQGNGQIWIDFTIFISKKIMIRERAFWHYLELSNIILQNILIFKNIWYCLTLSGNILEYWTMNNNIHNICQYLAMSNNTFRRSENIWMVWKAKLVFVSLVETNFPNLTYKTKSNLPSKMLVSYLNYKQILIKVQPDPRWQLSLAQLSPSLFLVLPTYGHFCLHSYWLPQKYIYIQ